MPLLHASILVIHGDNWTVVDADKAEMLADSLGNGHAAYNDQLIAIRSWMAIMRHKSRIPVAVIIKAILLIFLLPGLAVAINPAVHNIEELYVRNSFSAKAVSQVQSDQEPLKWKNAIVLPVPTNQRNPLNYRRISWTSVLARDFEKIP